MSEEARTVTVDGEEIPLKSLSGGPETERRRKLISVIADDYLDPDNPVDIDELVEKYDIPKNSISVKLSD